MFISRDQNQSEFLDDSFNVAQMYGDCLYRSENSAFDLCDHEIVSRKAFFFVFACDANVRYSAKLKLPRVYSAEFIG